MVEATSHRLSFLRLSRTAGGVLRRVILDGHSSIIPVRTIAQVGIRILPRCILLSGILLVILDRRLGLTVKSGQMQLGQHVATSSASRGVWRLRQYNLLVH